MWTATLLVVVLLLWIIYRKRWFSSLKEQGIPGPKPNLLFGNLIELIRKTPLECHREWLKKYGKVVGYYFGTTPFVLVADTDILKKIIVSDFNKFINKPTLIRINGRSSKGDNKRVEGFSEHLLILKDDRWREVRSIITPTFTASKLKQMIPIMNGTIDSLLSNIEKQNGDQFDIYSVYQRLAMDMIGRTAFGIHTDVQNDPNDPLLKSVKAILQIDVRNPILVLENCFPGLKKLWSILGKLQLRFYNKGINPFTEYIDSVKEVIAMRRRNKESRRPDLLQLMIDAHIDDLSTITSEGLTANDDKDDKDSTEKQTSGKLGRRMTDAEILDNSVMFFSAAYDTTSTALGFTTHFLVHYPEAQEKIRQEVQDLLHSEGELDYTSVNKLQYLDQVIQESLRLYPPAYLFVWRECKEDVNYGDFKFKKGDGVQVPAYHMHRDPELWGSDAENFNPERFSPENKAKLHSMAFQSFGAGPRNCVGMRFAYMEMKLTLARLLSKYRLKTSSKTEAVDGITLKIAPALINPQHGIWIKAVPV